MPNAFGANVPPEQRTGPCFDLNPLRPEGRFRGGALGTAPPLMGGGLWHKALVVGSVSLGGGGGTGKIWNGKIWHNKSVPTFATEFKNVCQIFAISFYTMFRPEFPREFDDACCAAWCCMV